MTVRIGFVEINLVGLKHSVVSLVACPQGPHSHILMMWGSEGIFWVRHFGQKGLFWVSERRRDFLGSQKQQGFFWVLYFSSRKSTITKVQFTACVVLQDISEIVIYLF